jgi:hypothetical protein
MHALKLAKMAKVMKVVNFLGGALTPSRPA